MNAAERTQAAALIRFVNFGLHRHGRRFAEHLRWLLEHEPQTVLTAGQKHFLQGLCYRYRRQLAGRVADEFIPTEPPPDLPEETPQQGDLIDGSYHDAQPVEIEPLPPDPQRRLL